MDEPSGIVLWDQFCDNLRDVGRQVLLAEHAPRDEFNQAEGVRYLTRLLRYATLNAVEYFDPRHPEFSNPLDPNLKCKIGGDNPDNIYLRASVSGHYRYRVSGTRGTVPLLTFGSKANPNKYREDAIMASTGELGNDDIPVDAEGRFSFIASKEQPAEGAWLPLTDDTTHITGRQSFQDRANETAAEVHIARLDDDLESEPLDPTRLPGQLDLATSYMRSMAGTFAGWTRRFMQRPNELPDWGQETFQRTGGDPSIFYVWGYWNLAPDEAWVIETEVPDCEYWNFVLQNWWMESLDHDRSNTYVNNHSARLNDDGTVTIVVAARDPGFGNWLSTDHHEQGTALMRWVRSDRHPLPTCKVVRI